MDSDSDVIEYCLTVDGESEEKSEKNEMDEKINVDLYTPSIIVLKASNSITHLEEFPLNFHPDISTPPPDSFLFQA